MASMASYVLKIAGSIDGRPEENADLIKRIDQAFGDRPEKGTGIPDKTPGHGWPAGFMLQGYRLCVWRRDAGPTERFDPYDPKYLEKVKVKEATRYVTQYTFFAEVNQFRLGSLYEKRDVMLPEVRWFYHYPQYQWYRDLLKILDDIRKMVPKKRVIQPIWFSEWRWYCGDGM
jgi:hypothetical protein